MRLQSGFIAAALAAATVAASPALAATTVKTYAFTLSDFEDIAGNTPTAPFSSVTGSFTITFDPDQNYFDEQTGIVVNSFSGPTIADIGFSYQADARVLAIGGLVDNVSGLEFGTDDFGVFLDVADFDAPVLYTCASNGIDCGAVTGDPTYKVAIYTVADRPNSFFSARTATVTSVVPEPASWAMMLLGFGGIATAMRRRKGKGKGTATAGSDAARAAG